MLSSEAPTFESSQRDQSDQSILLGSKRRFSERLANRNQRKDVAANKSQSKRSRPNNEPVTTVDRTDSLITKQAKSLRNEQPLSIPFDLDESNYFDMVSMADEDCTLHFDQFMELIQVDLFDKIGCDNTDNTQELPSNLMTKENVDARVAGQTQNSNHQTLEEAAPERPAVLLENQTRTPNSTAQRTFAKPYSTDSAGKHPDTTVHPVHSLMIGYTSKTSDLALRRLKMNLFNRTCYKFLNGRKCDKSCKWNHFLPPANIILPKLMCLKIDTVAYIYKNFVFRNNITLVAYFPMMCEVFGRRKMTSNLQQMIADCEKRESVLFLKHIFKGLILTGLTKQEAFIKLTENCRNNSRDFYDVCLEIFIETDPLYFIDMLEKYSTLYTISTSSLLQLLQHVKNSSTNALLTLFIDILDRYSTYNALDVELFDFIISRVEQLVTGDLKLSQKLNHMTQRMR